MRIPDDKIQEIRAATDIVEYIGTFVRLKKRGKNYIGLCPFHSEKTPSFNVSPDKGMYYCFGCSRGGDVIKFVMEWEKATYVEAIEILAERAGITIVRTEESLQSASETEKLYSACSFAAKTFYRNLMKTDEGNFALKYFQSRGFSDKTITGFGLGYSLRGWDALVKQAGDEGIKPEYLEKVGLARKRDDGGHYDAFRGRAMFPIFSTTGRVIAFGARKLYDDDTLGKYINSSETPIYHKSKILYGLHQAKEAIREKDSAILVEGYADLISVFQSGIHNVVASSGTALTVEQIQLIARYTKNVIFVYDGDSAGVSAMTRGVDLILENNLDVRVAELPQGDDPDSYVRKKGADGFQEVLSKAVTFVDFKANALRREGKLDSPEGKAEAVRTLVQTIAKIKDPLRQTFFIKDVAEKYKLYESALLSELEKFTRKVPDRFLAVPRVNSNEAAGVDNAKNKGAKEATEIPVEEKELLLVAFEEPMQMIPFIFSYVHTDEFSHPQTKEVAQILVDEFDSSGKVDIHQILQSASSDALRKLIAELSFTPYQLGSRWEKVGARLSDTRTLERAEGAIKRLKKKVLERELAENQQRMKDASLNGEDTVKFLKRHQEIFTSLKEIENAKLKRPVE
ncbi:MAG TPA: DNA primase [Bacteroidota bacterium]|nr:DNA primase [Bacteroidota bacterium]